MTRNKIKIVLFSLFFIALNLVYSCKKDNNEKEVVIEDKINFNLSIDYDSVTDIDGNTYKTVVIGNQTWMAENLKTTHYSNGDQIPNIINNSEWVYSNYGAYCWMENDEKYKKIYGAIYNYYAVVDRRNVCPSGWRVPSKNDWVSLEYNAGDNELTGGYLKEEGYDHWYKPNLRADNRTGFTALPAGGRGVDGNFSAIGQDCYWWSTTGVSTSIAYARHLNYNMSSFQSGQGGKLLGFSVRCVKN